MESWRGSIPKRLLRFRRRPLLVRAKDAEIGARTEAIPNLQSSLAFWYLHLDSELVFSGDSGATEGKPAVEAHRRGMVKPLHAVAMVASRSGPCVGSRAVYRQ